MSSRTILKTATLLAALVLVAGAADARTIKWARSGDALTLDPHAQNEGPTHNLLHQIYEPLILRDRTGKLLPTLATSWKITRTIRRCGSSSCAQGVKFHNGNAFNADDVVFSLERALQPTSDMKGLLTSIDKVSKVDDNTVHIKTKGPNPLLPSYLTNLYMMDKEWSEANNTDHRAGLQGQEGQLRRPQRQRHRRLRAGLARAGREDGAQAQRRLLGQGRSSRSASPRSPT